jgi:hypothetical protein
LQFEYKCGNPHKLKRPFVGHMHNYDNNNNNITIIIIIIKLSLEKFVQAGNWIELVKV